LNNEIMFKECGLQPAEHFGVQMTQFFQWLGISEEDELLATQIFIKNVHTQTAAAASNKNG
jgi:hypothetical protein